MKLRIWHFPNLGSKKHFIKEVETIKEAKKILKILADYDLLLGDLIDSNAQGLEVYVGKDVDYETNNGWEDWICETCGGNIDDCECGED